MVVECPRSTLVTQMCGAIPQVACLTQTLRNGGLSCQVVLREIRAWRARMVALDRLEKTVLTFATLCVGSIAFDTSRANESAGISGVAIVASVADAVRLRDRPSRRGRKFWTVFEKYVACIVFESIGRCFLTMLEKSDKPHVTQTIRGLITGEWGV
jgi:hypothetical protein